MVVAPSLKRQGAIVRAGSGGNSGQPFFAFNEEFLGDLIRYPHMLGRIAGKDRLGPLHGDWIRYVWDTEYEDRALQAHRGSYKTTAIPVIGSIWWLLFHPNDRIAIVRKTFTDAAEVVSAIMKIMEMPEVKELFRACHGFYPKALVKRTGLLTFNFKKTVSVEGSITAHGLDGSLTGKHYDKILCDDIITLKDRISKAERDRTKEMIRELSTNIIDPGKYVGWIGTPWHEDDGWSVIPAQPLRFPVSVCNILTPADIARKKASTTSFLYAANYDLSLITDENAIFKDPTFADWDWRTDRVFAHIDAAFGGGHYCAATLMSRKPNGRIQGRGYVYQGDIKDWLPVIVPIFRKYKVHSVSVETNPDKGWTADRLRAQHFSVDDYSENTNKHIKIVTYLKEDWGNLDWAEDTDPDYLSQVLDYREGQEPDDAPDSAASMLKRKFTRLSTSKEALYRM